MKSGNKQKLPDIRKNGIWASYHTKGSWPDALFYCVSVRDSKDSGEPGLDTAGQVHSYGPGLRASQKTPWNLEPGLVEPTVRAVERWRAALLGHLWGRGWWPWGAGMGFWAVGSLASPRVWTGMVRAGGALRTMAVTFFCEDIWEDLRNVHLQNREEQSSHPDRT